MRIKKKSYLIVIMVLVLSACLKLQKKPEEIISILNSAGCLYTEDEESVSLFICNSATIDSVAIMKDVIYLTADTPQTKYYWVDFDLCDKGWLNFAQRSETGKLVYNQGDKETERAFKRWLKELKLSLGDIIVILDYYDNQEN